MTLLEAVERAHRLDKSEAEAFQEYDHRTNKKMREHNRSGGDVRKPVRKVKGASKGDKWDRAKFNSRKAAQILSRKDPLKDDKGNPTPAAMQFKRWGEKVPDTLEDVRGILARANRQKERYRPDSLFWRGYFDVMRADAEPEEVEASPGDDTELAKMIVSALEDGYTSGIEALLSYGMEGDTIYGRFIGMRAKPSAIP